jgi:TonB family protein
MPEAWKQWEGQVVNEEFSLVRYLGASEHSAVFLTKRADREPQEVAIKLTLANTEDPELQLSWWELAAKLSHPSLLRLFQRGRCQMDGVELLYVVTEYAEESLSQIIPYRPLTPAEAGDTLQPLLDGLAYIHGKGFVHGHIKPANILAVGDQIKISSDGLCGTGESSRVLGKPTVYSAPELAEGGGVLPASDVWSLGITLVEAVTQSPPVWNAAEQAEPVLPETLPQPFFDIASHCLHRNPQTRWTVAEISARLQQPSSAPPPPEIVEPKSTFTRWGYLVPGMAIALLLLALLGPKLFHRHPGTEPEPSRPTESSQAQPEAKPSAASTALAPSNAPPAPAKTRTAKNGASKKAAASDSTGAAVQGAVAQQVLPDVSKGALRTIHGKVKVRVKVSVDSSGNVLVAKFDSRGPSRYFADRTLPAARRWTFKPPQVGGQGVPSEWILTFEFERSGINVHPAQTFP